MWKLDQFSDLERQYYVCLSTPGLAHIQGNPFIINPLTA